MPGGRVVRYSTDKKTDKEFVIFIITIACLIFVAWLFGW